MKFLRRCCEQEFDLPTDWLEVDEDWVQVDDGADNGNADPEEEEKEEDGSSSSGGGSDSDDGSAHEGHIRGGATGGDTGFVTSNSDEACPHDIRSINVGHIVFFTATCAPFLVGKVLDTRAGENDEQEVCVHWLSPVNTRLRGRASEVSIQEYGAVTFREDYRHEVQQDSTAGRRRSRRVKDTDWEPISRVVASCESFNARGTKVPRGILRTLEAIQDVVEESSAEI